MGGTAGAGNDAVSSWPLEVPVPERPAGQQDVIELTTPKLDTVRVGFIGLGMRGPSAVERWTHIPGTKIVALCDLLPENAEKAQKIVTNAGMEAPALYSGSEDAWKQLCERNDIDLVYIATDWKHHTEMGIYAMEHGKHAAIEVPAAMSLDEIWALINTSEKTELKKKRKQLKELEEHRDKLQEYDCHLETLQERNSYSKTDKDATFMRMKEDAMRNGQTKPGYNLQIGTENQFITDFALFPNPTDTLTLIPFLQSFSNRYDRMAHTVVADSGYGSEENYRFMSENGMEAYVKYNYFHMEQRPRFKPDPFKAENFYYNEEHDFCICPMGQRMRRIGTRNVKTASGYVNENARYRAVRCEGCPLRCRCFKAKGNRTIELNHRLRQYKRRAKELLCSEKGLKHRGQRCIEPEAVFGQMKNNMNYKRFRHFGKDKVFMDFAFFAIAFNIKKMCAKMTKEGMDWLIRPFYELTVVLFRC